MHPPPPPILSRHPRREERDLPGGVGERAAAPPGGRLRAHPGRPPGAPGPGARQTGGAAALAQPGRPQGAVTARNLDGRGKNGNGQSRRVCAGGVGWGLGRVRTPAPQLPLWDLAQRVASTRSFSFFIWDGREGRVEAGLPAASSSSSLPTHAWPRSSASATPWRPYSASGLAERRGPRPSP